MFLTLSETVTKNEGNIENLIAVFRANPLKDFFDTKVTYSSFFFITNQQVNFFHVFLFLLIHFWGKKVDIVDYSYFANKQENKNHFYSKPKLHFVHEKDTETIQYFFQSAIKTNPFKIHDLGFKALCDFTEDNCEDDEAFKSFFHLCLVTTRISKDFRTPKKWRMKQAAFLEEQQNSPISSPDECLPPSSKPQGMVTRSMEIDENIEIPSQYLNYLAILGDALAK